jgi:hypothetical protein
MYWFRLSSLKIRRFGLHLAQLARRIMLVNTTSASLPQKYTWACFFVDLASKTQMSAVSIPARLRSGKWCIDPCTKWSKLISDICRHSAIVGMTGQKMTTCRFAFSCAQQHPAEKDRILRATHRREGQSFEAYSKNEMRHHPLKTPYNQQRFINTE